ncbi:hypothetical protein ACCD06_26505 [Azospirillum sp. CT11-132]
MFDGGAKPPAPSAILLAEFRADSLFGGGATGYTDYPAVDSTD